MCVTSAVLVRQVRRGQRRSLRCRRARTTSIPLTVAWQRDGRDSALVPTSGRYQRANFEVSYVVH
jgi:outer membrane protein assembly factor BamA